MRRSQLTPISTGEAEVGHFHYPIARRPASVILSQVTTIARRAAIVERRSSETRPSRTRSRRIPIAKPCAIMSDWVHPSRERASRRSASCSSRASFRGPVGLAITRLPSPAVSPSRRSMHISSSLLPPPPYGDPHDFLPESATLSGGIPRCREYRFC